MHTTAPQNPTFNNPIWYRGYKIYEYDNYTPFHFCHDDYDGAPDSTDKRNGEAKSVEDAKAQIDEIEDDNA